MKHIQTNNADPADQIVIQEYRHFIENAGYPCIAAKAAMTSENAKIFVAGSMQDGHSDAAILEYLYNFITDYRGSGGMYHSATVLFRCGDVRSEQHFEERLWERLQALSDLDAARYRYDSRVSSDPASSSFSFSLMEEAFYIIGLHPYSSRLSRRFRFPAMVFNPHAQFEKLRHMMKYDVMKYVVRKRDVLYSGSVNAMLDDFGKRSETFQYSGRNYDNRWKCPLNIKHGSIDNHSSP